MQTVWNRMDTSVLHYSCGLISFTVCKCVILWNILDIQNVSLQAKVTLNFRFESGSFSVWNKTPTFKRKITKCWHVYYLFFFFSFYTLNYCVLTSVVSCGILFICLCQITYHLLVFLVIGCSMETLFYFLFFFYHTGETWQ